MDSLDLSPAATSVLLAVIVALVKGVLIVVVLMFRPSGIFGRSVVSRV